MAKSSSSASGGGGKNTSATNATAPSTAAANPSTLSTLLQSLVALAIGGMCAFLTYVITMDAYDIRLHAIREYGHIIHEFDPYFNFRATEYLHEHGAKAFFRWFDHMSWYPLGRPVGTTIYPGMQFTAVWLQRYILPGVLGVHKSLNDVCCLMPAWFGGVATVLTGLLAAECAADFGGRKVRGRGGGDKRNSGDGIDGWNEFGSVLDAVPLLGKVVLLISTPIRSLVAHHSGLPLNDDSSSTGCSSTILAHLPALFAGVAASAFMSIVPAHLMRSVGGGFDNESVAVTAMTLVFFLWTRSLRAVGNGNISGDDLTRTRTVARTAAIRGAIAGLAYVNMAAAWGGYVFVINLVAAHAGFLVVTGRHSTKLHAAYTSFFFVGTALATRIPVVGYAPLRSLEQLGPLVAFLGLQLVEYCERRRRAENLSAKRAWALRVRVFGAAAIVAGGVALALWPTGYFGPISSRIRGLFVPHTKTGNPLVDSVAEHQAATPDAYDNYLHPLLSKILAPAGFGLVAVGWSNDASTFLLVYAAAAYFFSHKMVRLILLTAPIACVLAGVALGRFAGWVVEGACGFEVDSEEAPWRLMGLLGLKFDNNDNKGEKTNNKSKGAVPKAKPKSSELSLFGGGPNLYTRIAWIILGYTAFTTLRPHYADFHATCHSRAEGMSQPTVLFKATRNDGTAVLVDDYREAYTWLKHNTPEDARIMAWWDYGYQISAIANRTTIADGNTWNHEHIALLGRALTSPMKEGHRIARHLADYVLVWTGGGGDDLAKSPHLARIANSVYRHMCPGDPTCSKFSQQSRTGGPGKAMSESLLYRLHSHQLAEGVEADKNRFKEVYKSKYGKVRIFKILSVSKESKEWVKNNRKCDAGGWYCPGAYPPGLQKVLKDKKDFKQLEDFNAKSEDDSDYQRQYFEHLSNPEKAQKKVTSKERREREKNTNPEGKKPNIGVPPRDPMSDEQMKTVNQRWEDNEFTSQLYDWIVHNNLEQMAQAIQDRPVLGQMRSSDGRGPMWWAHEHGRTGIVGLLKSFGVSEKLRDKDGITPLELSDDEF